MSIFEPEYISPENSFAPVSFAVPIIDLRRLCKLALEAGEDLREIADRVNEGDDPAVVRRREREHHRASQVIAAAENMMLLTGPV
jgi:hypothetical protein